MHEVFLTRYSDWRELESAISAIENSNLERGDAFEEFADFYFNYFRKVYEADNIHFPRVNGRPFPSELIDQLTLGSRDLGIDGIYSRSDGDLVAVQVKFRTDRESLTYRELATFWSEAERAAFRLVFTNAASISDVSLRRRGHLQVSREHLEALDDDFFRALHEFATSAKLVGPIRKAPRPYQDRALGDVLEGFASHDRGKLIAACGIGKTLLALWLSERMRTSTVLFIAPNLQLIRQTLNEWSAQSGEAFRFVAVCSDQTIASDLDELSNAAYGTDIPITTDPDIVASFLRDAHRGRKIVFSTYQSLNVVAQASAIVPEFTFDLAVFDEAHKTAGLDTETGFGVGLEEGRISIAKRLFMTATERLFSPRLQEAALDASRLIFSMDNLQIYGPTFHKLTFSRAISEGIISDYKIVVALLSREELVRVIRDYDLVLDPDDEDRVNQVMRTSQIFNYVLLKKAVETLETKKLVSYHSTVVDARSFSELINERNEPDGPMRLLGLTVNGAMPSSRRQGIIESFERAELGVLTNARCLIEGVDIPVIDGVIFASPKNSLVDIVQAVGRALRKPYGESIEKTAYVIIPVITNQAAAEIDVTASEFDRLFDVVQALRDQDDGVADQIDQLNLTLSTGGSIPRAGRPRIVQLIVPGLLSVDELEDALMLRIAEVNARPTGVRLSASSLGQGERGSSRERLLRTMGDYTVAKYRDSLVDPTLELMEEGKSYTRAAIRINNNNVGHAEKLGVILEDDRGKFSMTDVGTRYAHQKCSFEELFKNQMLLYRDRSRAGQVYPYRLVLKFMLELGSMRYWDFLYGAYSIDLGENEVEALDEACQRATVVRSLAIRPELANEASRKEILEQLTEVTGVGYEHTDVWTDRTTTFNQFRYFRRHLELFDELFQAGEDELLLLPGADQKLKGYLAKTQNLLSDAQYGSAWWLTR